MKQFSVAPFDQHLMLNGKRLTDDQAKLGALNITPGCVLHLQVRLLPTGDDWSKKHFLLYTIFLAHSQQFTTMYNF